MFSILNHSYTSHTTLNHNFLNKIYTIILIITFIFLMKITRPMIHLVANRFYLQDGDIILFYVR